MLTDRAALITTTLILVAIAHAGEPHPAARSGNRVAGTAYPSFQSATGNAAAAGTPCVFDYERGEVPDCIRQSGEGTLVIAPAYLKVLTFDSHGLAVVRASNDNWLYVNRKGTVVIAGVPNMDNWADTFHDGLIRIIKSGKYGFANRKGRIVIPAAFDGALNFHDRVAKICNGCKNECADPDCEHHIFAGGEWFEINNKGTVLPRRHPEP